MCKLGGMRRTLDNYSRMKCVIIVVSIAGIRSYNKAKVGDLWGIFFPFLQPELCPQDKSDWCINN